MQSRIGFLVTGELLVAAVFARLTLTAGSTLGDSRAIVVLAAAFAAGGLFTMRLEFRRHQCTFTLIEAVLSVAFFVVGPVGAAIAATVGEGVVLAAQRVSPLKAVFNLSNRLAAATVAAVAFQALGHTDFSDPLSWAAAIAGVLCFSLIDVAATATVLAIAERAALHEVLVRSVPTAALVTVAAAPLGPISYRLFLQNPFLPVLLIPLVAAVALNSRHAAAQRDEHLRFERLYEASARTAHLAGFYEAMGLLASEARSLGTGVAAVCCSIDTSGTWVGSLVGDSGAGAAPEELVGALVHIAGRSGNAELPVEELTELGSPTLDGQTLLLASAPPDAAGPLVVAVWRAGQSDESTSARVETLVAFANHASLTSANARLYEEREMALAHQVDLNRQKGDFVAAVSHELRTPLAVMLGAMGTMVRLEGRIDAEKRRRLMETAVDQGGRLQRLIDELLTVAAAEHETVSVACRPVSVEQMLEQVLRDTARLTEGRASAYVGVGIDTVVTDPVKLQHILSNLVENAGKYAPSGSIEVHASRGDGEIRFTVDDHGPGIAVEDRERVFQRFVQLDQSSTRRRGGTGLGLYLCRQLAGLLGGRLTLDEAPGGGCRFTVLLPEGDAASEPLDDGLPVRVRVRSGGPSGGVRVRPGMLRAETEGISGATP